MKIVLRSRGGFTGKAGDEVHEVDLARLPGQDACALADLVRAAGFFSLPAELRKAAPRPWDFLRSLCVSEGGRDHTVTFHDDAAPPPLRTLVERIEDLADADAAR